MAGARWRMPLQHCVSLASELAALFGLEQMELFMLLRVTASSTEGAAKLGLFCS